MSEVIQTDDIDTVIPFKPSTEATQECIISRSVSPDQMGEVLNQSLVWLRQMVKGNVRITITIKRIDEGRDV